MAESETSGERARAYVLAGAARRAPPLASGLHLVATPIGNLRDITLRAIETLAAADAIACEDTRVTGRLLSHFGIRVSMTPYHEHNAAEARPRLLARLGAGEAIALASDAGTPLVSDPGYKLVEAAREDGVGVFAVPGPSAVLAALTVSGLPTDSFFFAGFLSPKSGQRRARAEALAAVPGTLIFFETGPRLAACLADLAAVLGPRPAAVCRELTKLHEEVARGDLAELAARYASAPPRGEIVLCVAPPGAAARQGLGDDLDAMLRERLSKLSVKDASADVAAITGASRRDVYRRALELARGSR